MKSDLRIASCLVFLASVEPAVLFAADPAPAAAANAKPAKAGTIVVSGAVRKPGRQELVAGEALTLSNAILKAGGLADWADGRNVKLVRKVDGSKQTTVVNYDAIRRKADTKNDPVLQGGDRIIVQELGTDF